MEILIYIKDGKMAVRYPEGMSELEALAQVDCTLSPADGHTA